MTTKLIYDCDPGHDDAIALLLAAGCPEIELLAVTTVAGNQTIDKVTRNALAVATVAGLRGVPIAAGADRPLIATQIVAGDIHGESGMDGPELPEPTVTLDLRHAVDLIIELVMASEPKTVTLVATGALTNLALALRAEPLIADRVREVIFMGGSTEGGNWSATAEFNIAADPEAAQIVVAAPWKTTMVGLNVTHQALATSAVQSRIAAIGTRPAEFVSDLLEFFGTAYRDVQGFDSPPVHDAVAIALAIDSGIADVRQTELDVELVGSLTRGMTAADFRFPAPETCTNWVATSLNFDRFWDVVVGSIESLGDPVSE